MDTDISTSLRWILLAIGAVVLLTIYLSSHPKWTQSLLSLPGLFRRKQTTAQRSATSNHQRITPQVSASDDTPSIKQTPLSAPPASYLFVLNISATQDQVFSGQAILHAATRAGLEKTGTSSGHFCHRASSHSGLIHVTNIVKPGHFDWQAMEHCSTPGLSVFSELEKASALTTMDAMLDCAHTLSDTLGGHLLDKDRQVLTTTKIREIKEEEAQAFFA